jgi:beta-glucosidase
LAADIPAGHWRAKSQGPRLYDRLLDHLLANGIAPFPTLYHWDLPQALQDRGGWEIRDTAEAFADYAGYVAEKLSDRARHSSRSTSARRSSNWAMRLAYSRPV